MADSVVRRGVLKKIKKGVISRKQTRFFRLQSTCLRYWKDQPAESSSSPKGVIDLAADNVRVEYNQGEHSFLIVTSARNYELFAESMESARAWVESLRAIVTSKGSEFDARQREICGDVRGIEITLSAINLPKMDSGLRAKSDPYFVVLTRRRHGQAIVEHPLYRSEIVMQELNPKWNPFILRAEDVDPEFGVTVQVWDWDADTSDDAICLVTDLPLWHFACPEVKSYDSQQQNFAEEKRADAVAKMFPQDCFLIINECVMHSEALPPPPHFLAPGTRGWTLSITPHHIADSVLRSSRLELLVLASQAEERKGLFQYVKHREVASTFDDGTGAFHLTVDERDLREVSIRHDEAGLQLRRLRNVVVALLADDGQIIGRLNTNLFHLAHARSFQNPFIKQVAPSDRQYSWRTVEFPGRFTVCMGPPPLIDDPPLPWEALQSPHCSSLQLTITIKAGMRNIRPFVVVTDPVQNDGKLFFEPFARRLYARSPPPTDPLDCEEWQCNLLVPALEVCRIELYKYKLDPANHRLLGRAEVRLVGSRCMSPQGIQLIDLGGRATEVLLGPRPDPFVDSLCDESEAAVEAIEVTLRPLLSACAYKEGMQNARTVQLQVRRVFPREEEQRPEILYSSERIDPKTVGFGVPRDMDACVSIPPFVINHDSLGSVDTPFVIDVYVNTDKHTYYLGGARTSMRELLHSGATQFALPLFRIHNGAIRRHQKEVLCCDYFDVARYNPNYHIGIINPAVGFHPQKSTHVRSGITALKAGLGQIEVSACVRCDPSPASSA